MRRQQGRRVHGASAVWRKELQVSGLDCAEEVAILNRVVGPKVGGTEHLAFDVINGRMTILDSAERIPDDEVTQLVATTGMSAKPWDADNAAEDQAAHLARQKRFTSLSGGFWAAGFLFTLSRPAWAARSGSLRAMARCLCLWWKQGSSPSRFFLASGLSRPRPGLRRGA